MNESFSKNLSGALVHLADKMIVQVKADAQAALEANNATIAGIISKMEEASKGVTDMVDDFNKNLNATYKKSKTILDNRAKEYRSSVAKLFALDGWRQMFFWFGIYSSIATPIFLLILLVMNWL